MVQRMKTHSGFTLIELMITVAIVGILSMIAYPSYTDYMIRSRRSDAKAALIEAAQMLERNYTVANRYDTYPNGTAVDLTTGGLDRVPRGSDTQTYAITVAFGVAPANSYVLTATATGQQLVGELRLGCARLAMNHLGQKLSASTDTGTPDGTNPRCWR